MRVTQSMIARNMIVNMNRNREAMDRLQTAMSTGREVNTASDDPVRFARSNRYRRMLALNEQFGRNINDAYGWANNYESVMTEFYDLLVESKTVAIQGSDNTQNADTRLILADRIDGIIDQAISLANSSYVGKSIFAGTNTNIDEPFEYDGTTVTYLGNSGELNRRISEDLNLTVNINGTELEATGMFQSLIDLRDALMANDSPATAAQIEGIDDAVQATLSLASKVGLIKNHLSMTEQRMEIAGTNIVSFLSQTEDADLAEIISKYNNEEIAYKAALQTASKALHLNILDFI